MALATLGARQQPPAAAAPTPPPQQPTEIGTVIRNGGGAPTRLAVPVFIALTNDAETAAIAKTIGAVLWDDLNFEREFELIPRDTYATIPAAKSFTDVPFDRWREISADGVVVGTVQKTGAGVRRAGAAVPRRDAASRRSAANTPARARTRAAYAHTISDEIHKQQRNLGGVARTKLAFDSDRDGERMGGTIEQRATQGNLHRRLRRREPAARHGQQVAEHHAGLVARRPRRSRTRRIGAGAAEHLHLEHLTAGTLEELTQGASGENWLPRVVARRHAVAFCVDAARRQRRDLRRESRRIERPPAHQSTRRPTRRRPGRRPARRSPSSRIAAARRRSTSSAPTASACTSCSIGESYVDRPTWSPRAVQRDRVRGADAAPASTSRCSTSPAVRCTR